jgi:hypothetical protein
MTSAALASTSAAISTRAARLAVGAVVSYQILLIVLICETGSGSFLAHDQRVGYRALHLDGVGRVSHSALSYAALFEMLQSQVALKPGPYGTRHTANLRDRCDWGGNIWNRSLFQQQSTLCSGSSQVNYCPYLGRKPALPKPGKPPMAA